MNLLPEIIAHRGAPREDLENTLESFEIALRQGADGIELDVHATRDGVVVVHHDPVVNRPGLTVKSLVAIADLDVTELLEFPLRGEARLPTLDAVLDLVGSRATVYVEVKGHGIEDVVVACLKRHPHIRVAIHAFDHRIPVAVRQRLPGASIGLLSASYPLDFGGFVGSARAQALWQQTSFIDQALVGDAEPIDVAHHPRMHDAMAAERWPSGFRSYLDRSFHGCNMQQPCVDRSGVRSGRPRGRRVGSASWMTTSPDQDPLGASPADTDAAVERPVDRWRPVPAPVLPLPPAVHFVDGVRRVDAHVWIESAGDGAVAGIAASYAAGVVSCRPGLASVDRVDVRRGLFTSVPGVPDLTLAQVTYRAERAEGADDLRLSNALQGAMADAEAECALTARTEPDDLLVLDGPLGKRGQLARVLGMVKTHRSRYLPPELHALVAELGPAERTPVFRLTADWPRYSWYLRLPCRPGAPWSGVVRVECPDVDLADAVELAKLSQAVLPRYASAEHKDPRAPQNLYPIGGLERLLRRRLGDRLLLERALRTAAAAREPVPV